MNNFYVWLNGDRIVVPAVLECYCHMWSTDCAVLSMDPLIVQQSVNHAAWSVNAYSVVATDWLHRAIDSQSDRLITLHRALKLNWLNQCLSSLFFKRRSTSALLLKALMIQPSLRHLINYSTFWPYTKYYATTCHWNSIRKLNNMPANKRWQFTRLAKCMITLLYPIILENYWKSTE